jgi:phosphoglycolate phosphatase
MTLKLVIFDVDGTLVDSQGDILASMNAAFASVDLPSPPRDVVLGVVGLSLDVIFPQIAPEVSPAGHARMVRAYKAAYMDLRARAGVAKSSPLYPGALEVLQQLQAVPEILLGVATGKSKRGLDKMIEGHDLHGMFVTRQVADFHPSKPHPSMILRAMDEVGVGPDDSVMIGDTGFDMSMAAAAGVPGIGVSWGYHPVARLNEARHVIDDFAELPDLLERLWSVPL